MLANNGFSTVEMRDVLRLHDLANKAICRPSKGSLRRRTQGHHYPPVRINPLQGSLFVVYSRDGEFPLSRSSVVKDDTRNKLIQRDVCEALNQSGPGGLPCLRMKVGGFAGKL